MSPKRIAVAAAAFVFSAAALFPQQVLPRTAVIPLNPVGVAKADAAAFTDLVEVALVKTEVFDVLEQSRATVILEAQERSMADCTDESCAIEFGKFLAAEQIILGAVSVTGGTYILTAKIIDVTTGRTLRADTVKASSLKDLTGEVELLAFKLAGLTYRVGGEEQVARAFAEVFVETVPDDAEVLLNGIPKGRSPLLLEKVPVGRVLLEARKDSLYAAREVEATAEGLQKVRLTLEVSLGNVFIKSSVREGITVFLDGRKVGALGAGLLEDLPAGEHELQLRGKGYSWEGRVVVETGKTVSVEAYPREVGSIEYAIPLGSTAEVADRTFRTVLRGEGTLSDIPAGEYAVVVSGDDYETLDTTVSVVRAKTARLAPQPRRTQEYLHATAREEAEGVVAELQRLAVEGHQVSDGDVRTARRGADQIAGMDFAFPQLLERVGELAARIATRYEEQEREKTRRGFVLRLKEMEELLSGDAGTVAGEDVTKAEALQRQIARESDELGDLEERAGILAHSLRFRLLEDRRDALQARLNAVIRRRRGMVAAGIGVSVVGAGLAGLGGASYVLGGRAYADYQSATASADAVAAWGRVRTFTTLLNVGIAGGGVGLSVGPLLALLAPRAREVEEQLAEVEADLHSLGTR